MQGMLPAVHLRLPRQREAFVHQIRDVATECTNPGRSQSLLLACVEPLVAQRGKGFIGIHLSVGPLGFRVLRLWMQST